MREVCLHGELAEKFGADWRLSVKSPAEVIRAIEANKPGFMAHIAESTERGVGYQVLLDKQDIGVDDLHSPFGRETLHIVPVVVGAGKGGLGRIIIGAALIYASIQTGGALGGLMGGTLWGTGATAMTVGSLVQNIGVSLLLGGVAQMLVATPKKQDSAIGTSPDVVESYYFNGPTNNIAQGGAVPIGYGRAIVGSQRISLGITAESLL